MAKREEEPAQGEAGIKVKRRRRRLYEAEPEPAPAPKKPAPKKPAPKKPAPKKPAKATPPPDPAAPAAADGLAAREKSAQKLIEKYALFTAATGLVPVPLIDLAASSVLQVTMLKNLAGLYEIEYSEQRAKVLIGSLLGSVAPISFAGQLRGLLGLLLRTVPAVGVLAGISLLPAATWASTYALGKVFIQHFELGGTLLDFDPKKMRDHFAQQYAAAKAKKRV